MSSLYALSHESLNDGLNWTGFVGVEDIIDISVCVAVFSRVGAKFNDVVCAELCCLVSEVLPVLGSVWRGLDNVNTTVRCLRKLMCGDTGLLRWIVCDNQYIHAWRASWYIWGWVGTWFNFFRVLE
jgi:hypothetical protein